jgi:hypothetical protein
MATQSKARTAFFHSNTRMMGSNPTPGVDIILHVLCARVVQLTGRSPPKGDGYKYGSETQKMRPVSPKKNKNKKKKNT